MNEKSRQNSSNDDDIKKISSQCGRANTRVTKGFNDCAAWD